MTLLNLLKFPPSREAFARKLISWLRANGVTGDITFDRAEFRLNLPDDMQHFLFNHYRDICRAWPWQRSTIIARYLRPLTVKRVQIPELWPSARDALMPALRDFWGMDHMSMLAEIEGGKEADMVNSAVTEDICQWLAFDSEESIAYVGSEQLSTWGVNATDAFAAALRNLRHRSDNNCFTQIGPGIYASQCDDCYDASRILLTDVIAKLPLSGRPVAMAPHRSLLLIAGEDDDHALAHMAALAIEPLQDGRAVSGTTMVLEAGQWIPLTAGTTSGPGRVALLNLALQWRSSIANEQKALLERLLEKRGEDVFVATTCLVTIQNNEHLTSYATWSKGVPTYLPETDLIALVDPEKSQEAGLLGLYPRSALLNVCPELFQKTQWRPRRWLVDKFPSPEAMTSLAAYRLEN